MVGRFSLPGTALVAGLVLLGACAPQRPRVSDKEAQNAAVKQAEESVQQGIDKQKRPLTSGAKRNEGQTLRSGESIWLQSGKSRVLHVPYDVTRVSIGNPDLAGVVVLSPRSILINAKELPKDMDKQEEGTRASRSGTLSSRTFTPPPSYFETSVILWDSANRTDSHTVVVADFIDQQVILEVTIAELNRTKMEDRGVDFQKLGTGTKAGWWTGGGGGATTGVLGLIPSAFGVPAAYNALNPPPFPLTITADRPTFAFQSDDGSIIALVTMLEQNGLATVLAQPKILALSGQNAVFQVGGEIPIRIVTSFSAEIEFKPFGTLVNFLPRISEEGDIILTVTPEVSQADFNSLVEGVPSFRVRRASTSAKLRDGETLVLGGLVQRSRRENERGIPYLKDIPYLGQAFRSTSFVDEVTELMVVVTPRLVKPLSAGTDLDLPSDRGPFSRDEVKTKPEDATVTRPRLPTPAQRHR